MNRLHAAAIAASALCFSIAVGAFPPDDLPQRLNALAPDDPSAYLRLAEELADEPGTPDDLELARRLYVLAYELDRASPNSSGAAASACLGLAAIAGSEQQARWLRAVAAAIDQRYTPGDHAETSPLRDSLDTRFAAATVLGLVRAGDGITARRLLAQPGVRTALEQQLSLLADPSGGIYSLSREAEAWPDRECAGERIVRVPAQGGPEPRLCPVCGGDPGPRLTNAQLLAQIRAEWVLLGGASAQWSVQALVDPSPLVDVDPDALADRYGIDPNLSVFRDGRWQAPAEPAAR